MTELSQVNDRIGLTPMGKKFTQSIESRSISDN